MVRAESILIDTDHWRHIYLLIGLTWGIASAIRKDSHLRVKREDMLV